MVVENGGFPKLQQEEFQNDIPYLRCLKFHLNLVVILSIAEDDNVRKTLD